VTNATVVAKQLKDRLIKWMQEPQSYPYTPNTIISFPKRAWGKKTTNELMEIREEAIRSFTSVLQTALQKDPPSKYWNQKRHEFGEELMESTSHMSRLMSDTERRAEPNASSAQSNDDDDAMHTDSSVEFSCVEERSGHDCCAQALENGEDGHCHEYGQKRADLNGHHGNVDRDEIF
jgi:hypothetical protein